MNCLLKNSHYVVAELHWIYPHLERIDLLLQRYYYQKRERYDSLPESFLLTEDKVEEYLAQPQGFPHWLFEQGNIVGYPKTGEHFTFDALSLLVERFELTEFERDALLLGLLPHFDSRYHALFAALHGNSKKQWPSFAKRADLTGANIRNIALLASILASDNSSEKIENKHIERAVILELNKSGRLIF